MVNIKSMDYKQILVRLVENKISADEWLNWWKENEMLLEKSIPRIWFLKLKPGLSQGSAGAALISQTNAKLFLKKIGVDFNDEGNENFKTKWLEDMEDAGQRLFGELNEKMMKILSSIKFLYPNLYKTLSENLTNVDVLENELVESKLSDTSFGRKLAPTIVDFFRYISCLRTDDVILDFSMISDRENYIKIGEMWVYNDGDELLVIPNKEEVYLKNIRTGKEKKISDNFYDFLENELSQFIDES